MATERDYDSTLHSPGQRLAWWLHFIKARTRRKEETKVRLLGRHIAPGSVIFDIGAHFGYFAKEFCRLHDSSCRVYGFEPVSYTRSILARVMRPHPNFKLEPFALADKNGTAEIRIPIKKSGRLGVGLSHLGAEGTRDYVSETISLQRLDDYFTHNALARLDLIKCDVEGAELLVFRGGAAIIARHRPVVFCEINDAYTQRVGYRATELFDFFAGLGYAAFLPDFESQKERPVDQYEGSHDYLFVPRHHL